MKNGPVIGVGLLELFLQFLVLILDFDVLVLIGEFLSFLCFCEEGIDALLLLVPELVEGLLQFGLNDDRQLFEDLPQFLLVFGLVFLLEFFQILLEVFNGLGNFDSLVKPLGFAEGLLGELLDLGKREDLVVLMIAEDDAGGADAFIIIDAEVLFDFFVLLTHLHVGTEVVQEPQNHFVDWKVGELFFVLVEELALGALKRGGFFESGRYARRTEGVATVGEDSRNALGSVELGQAFGTFEIVHYRGSNSI